jgi:hypothetical protein
MLAGVLAALSLGYSLRELVRCRALVETTIAEQDELEKRLAEKELALKLGLARRVVRALARVTLFSGTGLAVWELTGGSTHYPNAAIAFVVGFAGWAGCGEVERRLPKFSLPKRPVGRFEDDDT